MSWIYYNNKASYYNNKAVLYDSDLEEIEVLWDTYGVPHIYSDSQPGVYYGMGWAQAKNHGNLIMTLYAQARGESARYLGSSYLESDLKIHAFNIPAKAQADYNSLDASEREDLESYVRGFNDYITSNSARFNSQLLPVLPITPQDVLGHLKRVISLEFSGGGAISQAGSNAYAVGPSKTSSGNAMLVINPHLPWSDYYLFFEAHIVSGDLDIYGVTLVGVPMIIIGFNKHLGWTHTVNMIDVADTYELTLSGSGYMLDSQVQQFNSRVVSVGVRQSNGSVSYSNYTLKESLHGPVLRETSNRAYAVRISGINNTGIFRQYRAMSRATSLATFEDAVKMMQMPMFNIVYADKHGDIMYLFNGNVPVKSEGNWSFWSGIIDGTQSKYIWNSIHPYTDLPRMVNPSTGWVQNANEAPWFATYPRQFDPGNYPSYFSQPISTPIPFRSQRSINLIKDASALTLQDLVDIKLDTGMEIADRFKQSLINAVSANPNPTATQAANVLSNWDGRTDTDSEGAILFAQWYRKLNNSMFSTQWSSSNPVTTPSGLSNPSQAVNLLTTAANEIQSAHGSMDVAWGTAKRFQVGSLNLPGNGGDNDLGVYRTMYFGPETQVTNAWHGDTFVSVVEFGDTPTAKALLSYGNASMGDSPFRTNQLQMLSDNVLRDVMLDKNVVLNNLNHKEILYNSEN